MLRGCSHHPYASTGKARPRTPHDFSAYGTGFPTGRLISCVRGRDYPTSITSRPGSDHVTLRTEHYRRRNSLRASKTGPRRSHLRAIPLALTRPIRYALVHELEASKQEGKREATPCLLHAPRPHGSSVTDGKVYDRWGALRCKKQADRQHGMHGKSAIRTTPSRHTVHTPQP